MDDDQEEAEMKKYMEIVVDEEEIAVDAIPLSTKPPMIVDWKIIKEGKMGYFQIIRADGSSRRYSTMIKMLYNIDREDLETLWKLVKAKHGNTRLEEAYERVKVKESLNVTFDETPPPYETSPLVDDDLDEEETIKVTEKKNIENDIDDETLEIDEIVNIKEARNHPLENVIRYLNQRMLGLKVFLMLLKLLLLMFMLMLLNWS
ncbi:hypothetical protein Tco_0526364 [Tanacetum coccineum]